ncbi:22482_t:CDS:2 [Entrophospora sp. SA101]|nr:22482_t:CDS:2 [Entrophospora sp. SA101]
MKYPLEFDSSDSGCINNNNNNDAPIIVSGDIKIVDLRPWVRGFDIKCILLELISKRTLKTNSDVEIHSFLVADETATCTLVIWDKGQHFREGDVVQSVQL